METVAASVTILGRTYKLRVAASDEEALYKAAETIETQARNYGRMYAYNDHQDLLAMVALTQITQLTKIQSMPKSDNGEIERCLRNIEGMLDEVLHSSQNSL